MTLDPTMFADTAVDPETRAFNQLIETALASLPSVHTLEPQVIRDMREAGEGYFGPLVRVDWARDRHIEGPAGSLLLREFVPPKVKGVFLHIHGGGFMLGRAHHQDVALAALALRAEVAVVSVDYRLAPEHPYPAGLDDCEGAAHWLVRQAHTIYGCDRLLIGGESAGANLAAATLLRLRHRGEVAPFVGAVLTFGVFDLGMTPSARRWGERNLIINTPIMRWFAENYASIDRWREPEVSPLYADLAGLPPALFSVGTLDPLLDDSLFMQARWIAAGNRAELAVYPGAIHGFLAFPLAVSRAAAERVGAFVAAA